MSSAPMVDQPDAVYDVAIIGAGINGTAAAQFLAADGYSVVLLDKEDFGSGATGRSSRFAHCGISYLRPHNSPFEYLFAPSRFLRGLGMARAMMQARHELVSSNPHDIRPVPVAFPIYENGPTKAWHLDAAFRMISFPHRRSDLLAYRRLDREQALAHPFGALLRDPDRLSGLATFHEYQFTGPERLCSAAALDAARMGATVLNYTAVEALCRDARGNWKLGLRATPPREGKKHLTAHVVLNLSGPWINELNRLAMADAPPCVAHTKGAHILVKLPAACRGLGLVTLTEHGDFFTAAPFDEFHYIGPTHTVFAGDLNSVHASLEDVDKLLAAASYHMPSVRLRRQDVLAAWAGVRPVTYAAGVPTGVWDRTLHDLGAFGMPNMLALTWGRLVDHRDAARHILEEVRRRLTPSGRAESRSYTPGSPLPEALPDVTDPEWRDALRSIAQHELVVRLVDILFRRTSAGWHPGTSPALARSVAETVAPVLFWDEARIEAEVAHYESVRAHFSAALGEPVGTQP